MKAWIISISIMITVGFFAFCYYIYEITSEPLEMRENAAVQLAEQQIALAEVRDVNYYHGRRSYQVIDAMDEEGNELYIWVEETDEPDDPATIEVREKSDGLTREEVLGLARDELSISSLKSVRLGMIGSTPIYEVNYVDDMDRHSFYYVTFEDGTYIRHYQFLDS